MVEWTLYCAGILLGLMLTAASDLSALYFNSVLSSMCLAVISGKLPGASSSSRKLLVSMGNHTISAGTGHVVQYLCGSLASPSCLLSVFKIRVEPLQG